MNKQIKVFTIQELFGDVQVCPGGKLVINVTVVGDQVKQIDSESFGNEDAKLEGVCVQENKETKLTCIKGNCTQNNLEINQNCEGGNCTQINGGDGSVELTTKITTTSTTTTTTTTKTTTTTTTTATHSLFAPCFGFCNNEGQNIFRECFPFCDNLG